MSEEKCVHHFVRNHQNQPLELHLSTGVLVLGPRAEAELQEIDLAAPQLKVLRRNRLVTTREVIETLPQPAPGGQGDTDTAIRAAVETPPETTPSKRAGQKK